MENNALDEIDDFDSGIELDKIEVPKGPARPFAETPAQTSVAETPAEAEMEIDFDVEPKKGLKIKAVIVVAFILLGAAVLLVSQKQQLKNSFIGIGSNRTGSAVEYHPLVPIITNLGAEKHIKIALIIKNHNKLDKQMSVTESIVRDRILMFLTAPNTKRIVNESDLAKVKSYINDELTYMFQSDYKDEIILKELVVY